MGDWILSYRIHGPSQVGTLAEIGEGTLVPKTEQSGMTAELKYTVSASSKEEAEELATSTYRYKAQNAVNCLSLALGDGLTLGSYDEPRLQGDTSPRVRAGASVAYDFILSLADGMVDTVEELVSEDEFSDRSLRWYNLGLSTHNPEDKFVAFWTGLEASFESDSGLSGPRKEIYREAKSKIGSIETNDNEFIQDLKTNLGEAKRERTSDSIERVLVTETDHTQGSLAKSPSLSDMVSARGDIVHRGKRVDNVDELAVKAEELLRTLLDSRLEDAYLSLLGDAKNDGYSGSAVHSRTEELFEAVFNEEIGKNLTLQEIQKRAYGLTRDIQGTLDIQTWIQNFAGWNEPLYQVSEGEYRYAPNPNWVTPDRNAILTYLYGAGWVSPEIVAHNINRNRRAEFDPIEVERIESECADLAEYNVVEIEDGFYSLTLDGEMCIEGRADPNELALG